MASRTLSEQLKPLEERLRGRSVGLREVLWVSADLAGPQSEVACERARAEVLKWAQARAGSALPPDAWRHLGFEQSVPGRYCASARIQNEEVDIWSLRADDPDKGVPGRIWTTEIFVGRKADSSAATFGLRLLVGSAESDLDFAPAVPGVIRQLCDSPGLALQGQPVLYEPWVIRSADQVDELADLLTSHRRRDPVLALSVLPDSQDQFAPLLNPDSLARRCAGIAKVVVVPADLTWHLTERFGKKLSVYNGAVRIFAAGFGDDADPYAHRLFLPEQVEREGANHVEGVLLRFSALESLRHSRRDREAVSFLRVRDVALEQERQQLRSSGGSTAQEIKNLERQISNLQSERDFYEREALAIDADLKSAQAQLDDSQGEAGRLRLRVDQLNELFKTAGRNPDEEVPEPTGWDDFEDWAEKWLAGRLVLSSRALNEIKRAQFKDVALCAKCLRWLAGPYRERRISGAGDSSANFRQESVFEGIFNTLCGDDEFELEWRGKQLVDMHIKSGGNSHDPRRMLRIYYFWHKPSQQIVVASMPGHVRTSQS